MAYKYDVAISYQSEIEEKAGKIADYLRTENLEIFFAPERQKEILSEKLHEVLYDIYKNQTFVRLLLISDAYLSSEWTQLEKRVSSGENYDDRKRKIVVDYTENLSLPKELREIVYINGKEKYEDEIASLVASYTKKLKANTKMDGSDSYLEPERDKNIIIQNNSGIMISGSASVGNINFNRE
ncbi:MAG: toll/interleukin-1 receptor domain-containing protein [Lachnospiraceae bacterium]|nr:toll/interleukin-1 receptor domain-containing protein [Lachnospiraceae bacterium]